MCGVGYMVAQGLVPNPSTPEEFEHNRQIQRELVEYSVLALISEDFRGGRDSDGKTRDGGGVTFAQQQGMDSIYWDSFQKRGDIEEVLAHLGKPKMADIQSDTDVPLLATGSLLLPRNKKLCGLAKRIYDETFEAAGYHYGEWRDIPLDNNVLGARARKTHPRFSNYIVPLRPDVSQDQAEREIEFLSLLAEKRIRDAAKSEHEASVTKFEAGEIEERQIQPDLTPGKNDFRVVSMSSRVITFKSLVSGCEIKDLFKDIKDPRFISPVSIFHQRESTNTAPFWHLAHPFGTTMGFAHNGEVNTKTRNIQAVPALLHHFQDKYFDMMRTELFDGNLAHLAEEIFPIVTDPEGSDSYIFAQVFGFLTRMCGLSPESAVALMVPPNYKADPSILQDMRDIYDGAKTIAPPWQGPMMAMAFDGIQLTVFNDQNGLRPTFHELVRGSDGKPRFAIGGSEKNMWQNFPGHTIDNLIHMRQMRPGERIAYTMYGGFLNNDALMKRPMHELADIGELAREHIERIAPQEATEDYAFQDEPEKFKRRILLANYDQEKVDALKTQAMTGNPVLASMGKDTQDPADSPFYHASWDSLNQDFSEVSDPPIDSVRETSTMSNVVTLGQIFDEDNKPLYEKIQWLDDFIVSNATYSEVRSKLDESKTVQIDCTFHLNSSDENIQKDQIEDVVHRVLKKAKEGFKTVILTDEEFDDRRAGLDMAAVVGAVNTALEKEGLRQHVGIIVRSAEGHTDHHAMVLKGLGADVVNFYLAEDIIKHMAMVGDLGDITPSDAVKNHTKTLNKGALKISAKKGVPDTKAYQNAGFFIGHRISPELGNFAFPGVPIPIEGDITLESITRKKIAHHNWALKTDVSLPLPHRGRDKRRESLEAEEHGITDQQIKILHEALRSGDYDRYVEFENEVNDHDRKFPTSTFDILGIKPEEGREEIPFDEIKAQLLSLPLEELYKHPLIRKITERLTISPMSYGSVSPEAKKALHAGGNLVGAQVSSGEGGEPSEWMQDAIILNGYKGDEEIEDILNDPDRRQFFSTIKQLGSGRFGVTPEYLRSAKSIEIKIAQGAKPGEGGQLMWIKVNHEIADARGCKEWTTLISPPPHHDIYSIEDLTQLLYDLKQAAPQAGGKIKLVSKPGVGVVANGCFKDLLQANAGEYYEVIDAVSVSGNEGSTGAAQANSRNHAGGDAAAGLAEANQALTASGFRNRAELHTDGGVRTSNDIMKRFTLGAERIGQGTSMLHGVGCIDNDECHRNTCPVGVASMDPLLRAKFTGSPEMVANYLVFQAIGVLEKMYKLGYKEVEPLVGRVEHLEVLDDLATGNSYADRINFENLLRPAVDENGDRPETYVCTTKVGDPNPLYSGEETLDEQLWAKYKDQLLAHGQWYYGGQEGPAPEPVRIVLPKGSNNHRALGTRLNARLAEIFHTKNRPTEIVSIDANFSAGQSLGTFIETGMDLRAYGACDYLGRGMAGGQIVLAQPSKSGDLRMPYLASAAGNTALYGATGGYVFVDGLLGNRASVRNSGAKLVALGALSFPAEYQTAGITLLASPNVDTYYKDLIPDGFELVDIFERIKEEFNTHGTALSPHMEKVLSYGTLAKGMSGGRIYVMDPLERMKHGLDPNLTYRPVSDEDGTASEAYDLIARHEYLTLSPYTGRLLRHWYRPDSIFNRDSMKVIEAIPNQPPEGYESGANDNTVATLTIGGTTPG